MRRAAVLAILVAPRAVAAPWSVTGEVGAEVDTNVERVETGPGLDTPAITAPVLRLGVHADGKDHLLGGGYVVALSDLTRLVDDAAATVENVTLLAGDLRWLHPIGKGSVAAGFGLTAADALPIGDPIGARTFVNLGADAVLATHAGDDRHVTLAFGPRHFEYKPDHDLDWTGPAINARVDLVLWSPPQRTKSLELSATLGFEARFYSAGALANACPPNAPPNPMCFAATCLSRRDRYQRVGLDLTWVGREVAAIGYQLTVVSSNSYGQSFAFHRFTASLTKQLPGGIFGTVLGVLQIESYFDGLVVQSDPLHAEFTNIDDENRSSLQIHLARKLSASWAVEARAAAWRNIGNSTDLDFHRNLVYAGAIYTH